MDYNYDLQTNPPAGPNEPIAPGPTDPSWPTPTPEPDPYPVTDPIPQPNPSPNPIPFPTPPEPIPQFPPDVTF